MERFHADKLLTRLSVCYSRQTAASSPTTEDPITCSDSPKYIQDLMYCERQLLVAWLDTAHVYVCGEDRTTAQVFDQFVKIVSEVKNLYEKDSRGLLMTKRLKHTYHDDTWT